jgi:hypothetical protein
LPITATLILEVVLLVETGKNIHEVELSLEAFVVSTPFEIIHLRGSSFAPVALNFLEAV